MTIPDLLRKIESEYECVVSPKHFFYSISGTRTIRLTAFPKDELYAGLLEKIRQALGDPCYVHGYYGFVWEKDGRYLTCNTPEVSYGCSAIVVYSFGYLPLGHKLKYPYYMQRMEAIHRFFRERNYCCYHDINEPCYVDSYLSCMYRSDDMVCFSKIYRKKLEFYLLRRKVISETCEVHAPCHIQNEKIRMDDVDSILQALERCFASVAPVE